MSNIEIIQGDCLEAVKKFDDDQFDLVLTDPPYNIGDASKLSMQGHKIKTNKELWGKWEPTDTDQWLAFLDSLFAECFRVCKKHILVFYDRIEVTTIKNLLEKNGYKFKSLIGFVKINPIPQFRKNNFRSNYELGVWASGDTETFNFLSQDEMKCLDDISLGQKFTRHPTEKPIEPFKKYIRILTNEGDSVLDPFLGSGTTAAACEQLGRHCTGIDMSEEYCEMAKKRIENEKENAGLFRKVEDGK